MRHAINDQMALMQTPEGPLVAFLSGFANYLATKGYAHSTIHRWIRLVADLSKWLKKEAIPLSAMTAEYSTLYLQHSARRHAPDLGDRSALRNLMEYLRTEEVVSVEAQDSHHPTDIEKHIDAYEQYLRKTRGLTGRTIVNYVYFIADFLRHIFDGKHVSLSKLSAADVVAYVQYKASTMSCQNASNMNITLRSFLRYLHYHDEGMPDLSVVVPAVATRSMAFLPRAIPTDQVEQLLRSVDRSSDRGRRDYAILLLLARLGLRAGEVAQLELNDIDWRRGVLHVRAKGGKRNAFPLSREIGEAIVDYLSHGRPRSDSARVFLRVRAPLRGFKSAAGVCAVVLRSIQQAGVSAPSLGSHQFRHALATDMLRGGASLAEIGDVLGHKHPDTTRIYSRIDLDRLRDLALPWPGGVR